MTRTVCSALMVCLLSGPAFAQSVPLQSLHDNFPPDKTTVYVAGKIITMDEQKPFATAVAVAGDRIVAVGGQEEVEKALRDRPYSIDRRFADKVIVPGLIDPHLHLWLFALVAPTVFITPDDWDLPWAKVKGITGRDGYVKNLREVESAMKDKDEWLFTWGYHQYFHGELSRKDLDGISQTRPIVVWHRSVHEMYLNTAALNALKITEKSLQGFGLASEQTDFAKGHFWDNGLGLVAKPLFPVMASPERFVRGLAMSKEYVAAGGITTTADPGLMLPDNALDALRKVFDTDDTPFRNLLIVNGHVIWDKFGPEKAIEETERMLQKTGHRVYFLPKQIKFFCDGAAFSQQMQLKEGYLDGHKGSWIQLPQNLEDSARLFWNNDYQIRVHVNGDLGNEVTIGILDKLMKETPRRDHRFSLDHYCVSTTDQAGQIASLGGIVSSNPYYVYSLADRYSESGVGPERAQYMVRNNSVIKSGIPLSLHSDTSMAPAKPLLLAWCAVNRLTMSGKVAGPEERISVQEALKAITINAAYALQKEKEIGSIVPGKLADLTIIEQDPLSIAPEKLKDIPVWGVVFEGKVFQNKSKDSSAASSLYMGRAASDSEDKLFDLQIKDDEHHDCTCTANQIFQHIARQAGMGR